MTAPLSPAPALTAEEAARVDGDDSREAPDAVLVDGDWISPSREAHARDLTKSWADAAANAGCPPAFVARMRTFVEVHDRLHTAALAALRGDHPNPAPVTHNHTRFRNDAGPWSPCPVSCPAAGLLR